MGTRAFVSVLGVGCALLGGLLIAGCEGDKPKTDPQTSASADAVTAQPGVDPRLASAVQSAAQMQDGGAGDGPPPNGVFAPGEADRAHPASAGRKLDVMSTGSEPRVNLRPTAQFTWPKTFTFTVAQRVGPQAMPTLEYTVGVKPGGDAKKAPAEGGDARVDVTAPSSPTGSAPVSFTIKRVKLAKMQPGAIPADLEKQVAKLEGSRADAEMGPDGALSNMKVSLNKGGDPGLAPVLGAFADALEVAFVPVPEQAVGAGAYWMVVDRARPVGLEFVRFRVYRVTELSGSTVKLSLDLRQYSVGGAVDLGGGGAPDDLTAAACESVGQGAAVLQVGQFIPAGFEVAVPVRVQLASQQRPGQAMVLQAEFATRLSAPPADDATKAPAAAAKPPAD